VSLCWAVLETPGHACPGSHVQPAGNPFFLW
jgi:hypothetical protein